MTAGSVGPDRSDAELLSAHVAGSTTAFGQLVRRHENALWGVALRMMRDPDDAADVVQDALVKAFRRADTFRGEARVSTWLHRIVVTTALDALRAARHADVLPFRPVDVADHRDGIAARQMQIDVADALSQLPDDQRAAVVLVDLAGFSVQDAAWALQCPVGTVKSRCYRARARLAPLLSAYRDDTAASGNLAMSADVQPSDASTTPPTAGSAPRGDERTEGQA
jgi:RNA polymerase sigma-70 factor (ECF subfamily)